MNTLNKSDQIALQDEVLCNAATLIPGPVGWKNTPHPSGLPFP